MNAAMNAKVRVAAICFLLATLAGLVLLVVRPSLNPAHPELRFSTREIVWMHRIIWASQ